MRNLIEFVKWGLPDVDGALLRRLAGDRVSAAHAQGRSLENHLRGTKRVLEAWKETARLQKAGLCHSLYSTDAFSQISVPTSSRSLIRSAIGKEAEQLVYLFCGVQRASFFRTLTRCETLEASTRVLVEVRPGFEVDHNEIAGDDARDLMVLHLANAAEQAGSRDGHPTAWLEGFSKLVSILQKASRDPVPEVLASLTGINRYAERQALASYFRAQRSISSVDLAMSLMEETSSLLPWMGDPYVWLSYLAALRGDQHKRRQYADLAYEKLTAFGVAWDKSLSFEVWLRLARSGQGSGKASSTFSELSALCDVQRVTDTTGSTIERVFSPTSSRLESYLLDVAAAKSRRVSGFFPGLDDRAFWDAQRFALARSLKNELEQIRTEVNSLMPDQYHNEAERIQRTGSWQVLMLLEAGRWNEGNLSRLPTLSRILKSSEEIRLAGGLVYLSKLAPGTTVAAHTGPTNMRLRLHFALRVPEGDCMLRVNGIEEKWVEGECTVFNDFLQHEVWNRTEEERLVLLVDIWHPDLRNNERKMLEAIHWMAEQHGRGLVEYWEKNVLARGGEPESNIKMDDLVM